MLDLCCNWNSYLRWQTFLGGDSPQIKDAQRTWHHCLVWQPLHLSQASALASLLNGPHAFYPSPTKPQAVRGKRLKASPCTFQDVGSHARAIIRACLLVQSIPQKPTLETHSNQRENNLSTKANSVKATAFQNTEELLLCSPSGRNDKSIDIQFALKKERERFPAWTCLLFYQLFCLHISDGNLARAVWEL